MVEIQPRRRPAYGRDHTAARTPDNRRRKSQARQAAEALFAPRPSVDPRPPIDHPVPESLVSKNAPPPERREGLEAVGDPEPSGQGKIPPGHFARIRTWIRYGMTIAQVAKIYGAEVEELTRILQKT